MIPQPEATLVLATGAVLQASQSKPSPQAVSIQRIVTVKRDGGWLFAAFQNTRFQQRPSQELTARWARHCREPPCLPNLPE